MPGDRKYLEMIKDDVSKIIKCQEKIKDLNLEIEKNLAKMHVHTVDFDKSGGCFGFRISVKGYLEIEHLFYNNMLENNTLNDLFNSWYGGCNTLLGKDEYAR